MIFHLVFHQSGGQINKVKTAEPHIIITLHAVSAVTRIFVDVLFAPFYPVGLSCLFSTPSFKMFAVVLMESNLFPHSVIPGDPTDILRSESFLDGSDHHDGAASEQLPTDLGSAGRRG